MLKAMISKLEFAYKNNKWDRDSDILETTLLISNVLETRIPDNEKIHMAWGYAYIQHLMIFPTFHRGVIALVRRLFDENTYLRETIKQIRAELAEEKTNQTMIDVRDECDFAILNLHY